MCERLVRASTMHVGWRAQRRDRASSSAPCHRCLINGVLNAAMTLLGRFGDQPNPSISPIDLSKSSSSVNMLWPVGSAWVWLPREAITAAVNEGGAAMQGGMQPSLPLEEVTMMHPQMHPGGTGHEHSAEQQPDNAAPRSRTRNNRGGGEASLGQHSGSDGGDAAAPAATGSTQRYRGVWCVRRNPHDGAAPRGAAQATGCIASLEQSSSPCFS